MSAGEVQAMLSRNLAYTTVMTTLARLHRKGAIARTTAGRAYRYALAGNPEQARANITAHQMLKLLEHETDRAGALTAFVSELRPEDERLLTDLLEQPSTDTTQPEST